MLIIFDLDGTLFKTHSIVEPAIIHACKQLNLEKPKVEMIHGLIGVKANEYYPSLFPDQNFATIEKIVSLVREFIKENLPEFGELYDGIFETIESLSSNHTLAICTNGHVDHQDSILHAMNINHFFKYNYPLDGSDKSIRIKKMQEICPLPSIMIGDKSHDIEAAFEANIPSIGVLWGYGDEEELKRASYQVQSSSQLLNVINSLEV
ncbi:HAD family hydrolase [bacterium]|nr:HAD family hydrolase [bacterium]